MRRLRSVLLLPLLGLALLAAGCGGDGSEVQEVPGPPVTLTVPHQKGAADVSASATPTPTATPTATATPTPAPATQDTPATDQKPAADGSPPQQFEQFCQENAGAC